MKINHMKSQPGKKKNKISIKQFLTVRCREVCQRNGVDPLKKLFLKKVPQNPSAQRVYNRKQSSATGG